MLESPTLTKVDGAVAAYVLSRPSPLVAMQALPDTLVIKTRSMCFEQTPHIFKVRLRYQHCMMRAAFTNTIHHQAFPDAKVLYMYRNGIKTA